MLVDTAPDRVVLFDDIKAYLFPLSPPPSDVRSLFLLRSLQAFGVILTPSSDFNCSPFEDILEKCNQHSYNKSTILQHLFPDKEIPTALHCLQFRAMMFSSKLIDTHVREPSANTLMSFVLRFTEDTIRSDFLGMTS